MTSAHEPPVEGLLRITDFYGDGEYEVSPSLLGTAELGAQSKRLYRELVLSDRADEQSLQHCVAGALDRFWAEFRAK